MNLRRLPLVLSFTTLLAACSSSADDDGKGGAEGATPTAGAGGSTAEAGNGGSAGGSGGVAGAGAGASGGAGASAAGSAGSSAAGAAGTSAAGAAGASAGGAAGTNAAGSSGGGAGGATLAGKPWENPWPAGVQLITLDANGEAIVPGDLSTGAPMADLTFAAKSSVACFPATQNDYFAGNQVLYALAKPVPPKSILTVEAVPKTTAVDVNLYGLRFSATHVSVPPAVSSAVSCEAGNSPTLGHEGNPGVKETISFQNPTQNSYNQLFSVAGPTGVKSGAYDLKLKLVAATPDTCTERPTVSDKDGWDSIVNLVDLNEEGVASFVGDLANGQKVCTLDWADNSGFACFPEPQFEHFAGNQVFYALRVPQPARSILGITVTPDPGVEVNLYGYRQATTSFDIPPFVPGLTGVLSCEASLKYSGTNPGEIESIGFQNPTPKNEYNVFFAVSGDKTTGASGKFKVDLKLQVDPAGTCPQAPAKADKWPGTVKLVSAGALANETIAGGQDLCTLAWANTSSVACFPATENENFRGKQRFYALSDGVGPGEKVTVTITPKNADKDLSLYGYWLGTTRFDTPPFVPSVGACESSYGAVAPNPGAPETISFVNPTGNTFNYFFAVSGVQGTDAAQYDLDVKIEKPGPIACSESLPGDTYASFPSKVTKLSLDETGHGKISGDLSAGACTALGWAADSDTACFPATQNAAFSGNHVYYALDQLVPPGSKATVTVTPKPGVDVSLYGYLMGATSFYVPPRVPSVVTCEASNATSGTNPGVAESIGFQNPPTNKGPYNLFFGVTGPSGVTTGAYDIDVQVETGAPQCPESLPGTTNTAWPTNVKKLTLDAAGQATAAGNVSTGACANLDFADDSQNACFPATKNRFFTGKQVFYTLDAPVPAGKKIDVYIKPKPGVDVSAFGYLTSTNSFPVPPLVPSVVACEASYPNSLTDEGNPGAIEKLHFETVNNPYQLFFSVAGAEGAGDGAYDVFVVVQ